MEVPTQNTRLGRPPIADELWNTVVEMAEAGVSPKDAIEKTGLSQTKVYEIYRHPVKKNAPAPSKNAGL